MNQNSNISSILEKLRLFKRKFYLNQLLKGVIISSAYLLFALIAISLLEYRINFNSIGRSFLFTLYTVSGIYFLVRYILIPAYHLATNGKSLTNEEAAKQIGWYFPEIQDKLLNIIQLNNVSHQENSLIQASISQKAEKLSTFNFSESIDISETNKRYLPYFIVPAIVAALFFWIAPNMITEGSYRVINFQEEFIPKAPFTFIIENKELKSFKGETYQLRVQIIGAEIPNEIFIQKEGVKQKLQQKGPNEFEFTFNNLQKDVNFYLQGAGFDSKQYLLEIFEKPRLQDMNIDLNYPAYTKAASERISNSGNLIVPEGTKAKWFIKSRATDDIQIIIAEDSSRFDKIGNEAYSIEKQLHQTGKYHLALFNKKAHFTQKFNYSVEVIKDKFPDIKIEVIKDSSFFRQVAIAGEISDDYGFSRLQLLYEKKLAGTTLDKGRIDLEYTPSNLNQKFFKVWQVDSLLTDNGVQIEYYIAVSDNDGINGAKTSKSALQYFELPDIEKINESIKKSSQNTEYQLDKNISVSTNTREKLDKLEEILKTKQRIDWEDKKLLEEILEQTIERQKALEKIKEQSKNNQAKRERFKQQSPELDEKAEQLQSLMEEMLKDEDEELLEKIRSLMDQQEPSEELRESVQKLNKKEKNKLKEMERLMELFKRLEIQYDLNEVGKNLKELVEEQEKLAKENSEAPDNQEDNSETPENTPAQKQEENIEKQKDVNESFDEIQKELREIEKRNQSLKQPNPLNDTREQENEINISQQNSLQELQKNNDKGAAKQQKQSSEQMKKMSEMLSSMQMNMEMEMLQENIDDLRDIVDNLLKLSFRQEALMKAFREVDPSDPRFITLSEQQLAMKDDAVIIEDSLNSLAERVFQLKTFINKEIDQMNESMDKSISSLKERDNGTAIGQQQFAMTSMNNLALMLDDVLQQMQMQMQASSGMGEPQQGNMQQPSLSELQESLNQQTQELSKEQRSGREMSEKLGELAGEQMRIRQMMEEMQKEMKGGQQNEDGSENGGSGGDIIEEMEKIEEALVNKRINSQLIERQKRIVTRLLEAEKAKQEQEEEDERKGNTATEYERTNLPNAFEEYLEQKRKEIEQLQNVPPSFSPYYKNEINKYYNRLKSKEI